MRKIRVAIFEPHKSCEIREIDATLESYQAIVGGYIEMVYLTNELAMYVNEEGMLLKLPWDRGYFGTFFVFRCDAEGNEQSITDEDIMMLDFMNR